MAPKIYYSQDVSYCKRDTSDSKNLNTSLFFCVYSHQRLKVSNLYSSLTRIDFFSIDSYLLYRSSKGRERGDVNQSSVVTLPNLLRPMGITLRVSQKVSQLNLCSVELSIVMIGGSCPILRRHRPFGNR